MDNSKKEKNPITIHSVAKAMELALILKDQRRPMSLNELAQACGYPKSTIYAILSTMRKYGFIQQKDSGKYFLGIGFFECGSTVSESWDITSTARPHVRRLAVLSGSSAALCYLSDESVINTLYIPGGNDLQISIPKGLTLPLHATSQGKLLLSKYTNDEVREILKKTGMKDYSPHTITDMDELISELDNIRIQGYSTENGEYKIGLRTVSAPVFDSSGNMTHALSVMNLFRDTGDLFHKTIEMVVRTAETITEELQ